MLAELEQVLIEITANSLQRNAEKCAQGASTSFDYRKAEQIDDLNELAMEILEDPQMETAIFAPSFRTALGHLISIQLDSFSDIKLDIGIRIKCGKLLCTITDVKYRQNSVDFIAFILPGVFAVCQRLLLDHSKQAHSLEIIKCASQILTNVICIALSDHSNTSVANEEVMTGAIHQNNLVLSFNRDEKWMKMAKEKILQQLALILSKLSAHDIDMIRFESVQIVSLIYEQEIFGEEFERIALDALYCLHNDAFESTKQCTQKLLQEIRSNNPTLVESHVVQRLTKSLKLLVKDVKNSADGRPHFDYFINLAEVMGPALLGRFFACQDFVENFMSAVLPIISVDKNRQLLSQSKADAQNPIASLPSLNNGICAEQLIRLSQVLVQMPNFEDLFDWLVDEFISVRNTERQLSIAFLIYSLTLTGQTMDMNMNACQLKDVSRIASSMIELLRSMDSVVEEQVADDHVENNMPAICSESCLVQLLLGCLSLLNESVEIEPKLRANLLYELLRWCSSSNFAIREAAENSLIQLSLKANQPSSSSSSTNNDGNNEKNVSDFLFANVHLIIFKVELAAHDFALNPRFPLVLAELVSRCEQPAMYPEVRGAVDEIMLCLDQSDQQRTMLLLRALRDYSRALLRWFPELKPPPVPVPQEKQTEEEVDGDDDEEAEIIREEKKNSKNEGDPNFPLIANGIAILNRTKHFISSPNLPVQLLVLDILHSGLQFVRNYENELLPMIHQNWHGLVRKFEANACQSFSEAQKLVAAKAINLVETICLLSGDFVYWKIAQELLPKLDVLLRILLRDSGGTHLGALHRHSATFKLQNALLNKIPTIVKESGVHTAEHLNALRETLELYANNQQQIVELRLGAKEAMTKLDGEFIKLTTNGK